MGECVCVFVCHVARTEMKIILIEFVPNLLFMTKVGAVSPYIFSLEKMPRIFSKQFLIC